MDLLQLVYKISNLCGHDPPTSRTARRTDRRRAIARPRLHYSASRGKKNTTCIRHRHTRLIGVSRCQDNRCI